MNHSAAHTTAAPAPYLNHKNQDALNHIGVDVRTVLASVLNLEDHIDHAQNGINIDYALDTIRRAQRYLRAIERAIAK